MNNKAIRDIAQLVASMTYKDMMAFAETLPEISVYHSPGKKAEALADWADRITSDGAKSDKVDLLPPLPPLQRPVDIGADLPLSSDEDKNEEGPM